MNEKLRKHIVERPHTFAMKVSAEQLAAVDNEKKVIPCSFAAPSFVERWYGILVLSFAPEAVNLERWSAGVAYLMNHNTDDQRGIILNGRLENDMLLGDVKFSKNEDGQELFQDIADGIRPWTSVGFTIDDISEIPAEQMPEDLKNMCIDKQCMAYAVNKWTPYEGSSVSVPANPGVGVMQMDYFDGEKEEQIFALAEQFGIERFAKKEEQKEQLKQPIIHITQEATMPEVKTKEQLAQEKRERKAALLAFGANYKDRIAGGEAAIEKLADDTVSLFENEPTEKVESLFRGELFTRVNDKRPLEKPASFVDMTEAQVEEYSITKVMRYLTGTVPEGGKKEELGIEKEIHQQILANNGKQTKSDSILLPMDLFSGKPKFDAQLNALLAQYGIRTERFDQTVGSTTGGGYLVGTQHRPQDFVEVFLNAMIQGFTYLPGLSGNVDIPKMTGGAAVDVNASEAATFAETNLVFGQLLLSPKEIGAWIDVTRRLMVQSSPAIDNLVSIMLFQALALKINYYAVYGSGGSGQPYGIVNTSGIGTFDGTSLGRAGLLNAESDIRGANVRGPLQWLISSTTQETLKGRDQTAGYGQWLMNDNGNMIGYGSQVTEQMSANTLLLGQLSEVIVAGFGNAELLVDRSTAVVNGGARFAIYDMFDVGVKHPGAFSYASSVS